MNSIEICSVIGQTVCLACIVKYSIHRTLLCIHGHGKEQKNCLRIKPRTPNCKNQSDLGLICVDGLVKRVEGLDHRRTSNAFSISKFQRGWHHERAV